MITLDYFDYSLIMSWYNKSSYIKGVSPGMLKMHGGYFSAQCNGMASVDSK